ncbi:hypothetical protein MNV49_004490 [Pseudohyphozyma bogoriensis]|nr:hypothetical protein MNV49_004490 [Pseudohyphozyma bogoriensis]
MATIASLPPELVLLILSFAISSIASASTPTPTYDLQRRQLLLRASLVSRAWRGPAQSLLWSEISFPTNEGVRRLIESEGWKKRSGRYRTRKLEVSNGVREYAGSLLEVLRGVEELYLGGVAVGEELFAYPAVKNLKKLTLFRTSENGHQHTASSPSATPESPTTPSIDVKLTSLALYYVDIELSSTIASILHSSSSSLRSLTFVIETLHESHLSLLQSNTRHLTHLVLDAVYTEEPHILSTFYDSLASLSHLELPSDPSLLLPLRRCSRTRITHFVSLSLDREPTLRQLNRWMEVMDSSVCEKLEVFEIAQEEARRVYWWKVVHHPITLIVCATSSNGIGVSNALPWRLPLEMAYFAKVTKHAPEGKTNAVVMGRKSWDGIPKRWRPLQGRNNVVVSRRDGVEGVGEDDSGDTMLAHSLESAVELAAARTDIHRVFLIGGAQLYNESLLPPSSSSTSTTSTSAPTTNPSYAPTRILLTRILQSPPYTCDAFIPEIRPGHPNALPGWKMATHEELEEFVGFEVARGEQSEVDRNWKPVEGVDGAGTVRYRFEMWATLDS